MYLQLIFITPQVLITFVNFVGLMFATPQAFPHPHALMGNNLLEAMPTHASGEITNDLSSRRYLPSSLLAKSSIHFHYIISKTTLLPKIYYKFCIFLKFIDPLHLNMS